MFTFSKGFERGTTFVFNLLSELKYAITSFVALINPSVVGVAAAVPTPKAPAEPIPILAVVPLKVKLASP